MPVLVHVDELEPGMRLWRAIQRGRQIMLPAGRCLQEWEINALRRRFPGLTALIGDPVLDEWVAFQDDSREHQVAATVNGQMGRLMGSVRDKLSNKTSLEGRDVAGLQKAVAEVMHYINANPVTAALLIRFGDSSNYMREHAGNVFYVSLLLGNSIRDYIHRERERNSNARHLSTRYGMDLTPLALGCLFHDLGMIPIEHLYSQAEPLSQGDSELIRDHPNNGVDMLPKRFNALAKMIVRTHHENFDGTGYPQGIPGESLHVFSRVIRVADAYDAATSSHVYHKAKNAARVLWEMAAGPHREHYDPVIVKILMGLIQPFPIGAKIELNDGRYGVVVRHNRKHPFRPTIIVAFDEEGEKLKKHQLEPPVDLAHNDKVRLVSFAGDDLAFLNADPDDSAWAKPDPAIEEIEQSLFDMVYP